MSRRDQIRMSEEEIRDFIAKAPTIIASSIGRDGVPHPIPMWFAVEDDGAIVMTTYRSSQKIKNLRRDPRVSLLVEDGIDYAELRGVVFYGSAELLEDVDEVAAILAAVSVHKGAATTESTQTQMRRTAEKRTGIRVRPSKVVSWDHRKLAGAY